MSFGMGTDPQVDGNQSRTASISSSANGLEEVESVVESSGALHGEIGDGQPETPSTERESEDKQTADQASTDTASAPEEKDGVQFAEPDCHVSFVRQQSGGDPNRPRCPVYVYSCALDSLKQQLVHPLSRTMPKDVFLRSLSQERNSTSWTDLMGPHHKQKELANYCSLLQEHYCQSYVRGVYRSLQQSHSISSQDILTAMDYCEESLQEIDITSFLQTLCGHIRMFRERHESCAVENVRKTPTVAATFIIGEGEEEGTDRPTLVSSSSVEQDDVSESECRGKISTSTSTLATDEPKSTRILEFPLSLLQSKQKCEVYPELHKIIQDKFKDIGAQYFKTVPSNPHYFIYCPESSRKEEDSDGEEERKASGDWEVSEAELATEDENVSGCCIVSESDTDLEVEYQDQGNGNAIGGGVEDREADGDSLTESDTMNQDEDSFSILEGDSLLDPAGTHPEMPPLFIHLVCSVGTRSHHGSMPMSTLPPLSGELVWNFVAGEVISCLDNVETLRSVDLSELTVTLDIFVLTLPLEIDVMPPDFHHSRQCSTNDFYSDICVCSTDFPSSYRSDDELIDNLNSVREAGMDSMAGDSLSKLPAPQKQAVLATMDEIHWLLEDEIVSALRLSCVLSSSTLQKVADHVCRSSGRPGCHHEVVTLQFVFGPDQSLEKFKEEFRRLSFPGYLLNAEKQNFHYVSLSRQHSHRLEAARQLHHNLANSQGAGPLTQRPNQTHEADGSSRATANHLPPSKGREGEVEPEKTSPRAEVQCGVESQTQPHQEAALEAEQDEAPEEEEAGPVVTDSVSDSLSERSDLGRVRLANPDDGRSQSTNQQPSGSADHAPEPASPPKTPSSVSLAESVQSATHSSGKLRPSRVQSVVSSQGSMDSDMLGYDGGSSDSECDGPTMDEQETPSPLMPDFWLIIRIDHDRVEVFSHSRSFIGGKEDRVGEEDEEEIPEYLRLHHLIVRKIGEICRIVNQRLLLQDLHDSHVCNSLLVAESEEDIWKNESLYRQRIANSDDYNADESYQPRDYLAATMHFIPGYFACDVVWSTIIHIHPRLKMGPNMGVARAIQALRSVLSAFCVVNRKNMFVYQERTTKSVFYLRLSETSQTGKYSEPDGNAPLSRSVALARSQEPLVSEDITGSRSSLEGSRPVGQADKHILLLVHGVGRAGPEITDELVKVLRKRLDETTLDIITVMLVRNCKLTPADVEFIQPPGFPAAEVMEFRLPHYSVQWMSALAHYLRQNLLMFLHIPKYTDSYMEHHFKHHFHLNSELPDSDIYLYNKPGGQGTGGKGTMTELVQNLFPPSQFQGIACIALSFVDAQGCPLVVSAQGGTAPPRRDASPIPFQPDQFEALTTVMKADSPDPSPGSSVRVRFDVWEQGNISPLQLMDKLRGAVRHALCDVVMEMRVLPNPLCLETFCVPGPAHVNDANITASLPQPEGRETKDSPRRPIGIHGVRSSPSPITLIPTPSSTPTTGANTPESTTPTGKSVRRSFWEILSKPDSSELGSPKTTDDIVQERADDGRLGRRRHKTESVKQQWSLDRTAAMELEQVQRRHVLQLEEGDVGTLHPVYQRVFQPWVIFMAKLGCPSIQHCTAEITSLFLLSSVLTEVVNLVTSLAPDTTVKVFERTSSAQEDIFVPLSHIQTVSPPSIAAQSFILIGRNFHQWHSNGTEQVHKGLQRFEALEHSDWLTPGQTGRGVAPRQRFLYIYIVAKKLTLYTYNWSVELGALLNRDFVRLVQWHNARAHVVHGLLSQKMGLFHHYCFSDAPAHEDLKQEPNPFLNSALEADALLRSPVPPSPNKDPGRSGSSARAPPPMPFPAELIPFDEALRDVSAVRSLANQDGADVVSRHGAQLLEVKAAERRELEKQMKIENLFVTWQQRSAQSNMPISEGTGLRASGFAQDHVAVILNRTDLICAPPCRTPNSSVVVEQHNLGSTDNRVVVELHNLGSTNIRVVFDLYNLGSTNSRVVVELYNLGSTNSRVVVELPNMGSTNIRVVVERPNLGSTNSRVVVELPNLGSTNSRVVVELPNLGSTNSRVVVELHNLGSTNSRVVVADLDTLKQSSRLVHYCATPLLFDPAFRKEMVLQPQMKKRHRSSDSTASGRDRSYSTDSAEQLPAGLRDESWLQDLFSTFMQQYVQYLQSMGFILVQVRPHSPARSIARARAALLSSLSSEGRSSFSSFSCNKQKSEDSPKQSSGSGTTAYHLQRALPGGIMLMELAFQGFYFCVKQYALECSRIPMGQTVNSQSNLILSLHQDTTPTQPRSKPLPGASSDSALSMLFTEECDKVRDLMHVHSFSYDFHLRVVHQYLVGCHLTLRQGYQLNRFLEDFITHHPDIPKFGHNHVFQGSFSISTGMITAHQLYNYITDHAGTYSMKPLRMSKTAVTTDSKKGAPNTDLHEYALVALWNSSGVYKDPEGLCRHDDFDVSLVVCHNAAPFEEQSEGERHLLRLRYYVIMTSQRELFPRLTADMRRFKKLPHIYRDPNDLNGRVPVERAEPGNVGSPDPEPDLWEETTSPLTPTTSPEPDLGEQAWEGGGASPGLFYLPPLFPLLNSEVLSARRQIQSSVEQAMGHCRRDNLWRRLFHGEHLDRLKLSKLTFGELEELLNAVQSRSIGEIDPQLDCFLTMSPAWYQSLIKVLLSRFPQSCRHFVDDSGIQYLAVLNQKFTDCFVLVFLDAQAGKTSLKVVFREPLPSQPQPSNSPPPQLVSMYHHLESVINTACYNLWTGLL
ncbi:hypothetical protein P4O66_009836 [Electrophorus voltai]|uniref:Uncharacterized protein n=1 Tax=Electrophorus voltai TaxID=2609070 RepID=A0AAD9DWJ0_9TELE|nr:hypothetical protein P4O66_009836 [Electrophorus voltai]